MLVNHIDHLRSIDSYKNNKNSRKFPIYLNIKKPKQFRLLKSQKSKAKHI